MTRGWLAVALSITGCTHPDRPSVIQPVAQTQPAPSQTDDPAIWINAQAPANSRIVGTVKADRPNGAVVVYDLSGQLIQSVGGLARPNNVDVEYGFRLGGATLDVAACTARDSDSVWIFAIDPASGRLRDISAGGIEVFNTEPLARRRPMGIAIYRRPADGSIFIVLSRKTGPRTGYLWEYQMVDGGNGQAALRKVREFGNFSGKGEIEAIAIDDEFGFVYYADEWVGIHKWHADPSHPGAGNEIALFAAGVFAGDREGLAIYAAPNGAGYLVATDQLKEGSRFYFYPRTGEQRLVKTLRTTAIATDGIEITSAPLGPAFPLGAMVAMNESGRNFLIYDWRDVEQSAR